MASETKLPPVGPGLRLAIDVAPLAVFFVVNFMSGGPQIARLLAATTAFMVASAIAMVVSRWKTGRISPMLWMTGTLVLVFGGATLYFHNETFIKIKPTFVYASFAAILAFGLATGRPLLQSLLETAYPGLTEQGWRKLTINWTIFFACMAVLNEVVWRNSTTDFWVAFKLWGAIPLTLVFAVANVPMLMKHGLNTGQEPPIPPEG
jgi:intracellular septation protein